MSVKKELPASLSTFSDCESKGADRGARTGASPMADERSLLWRGWPPDGSRRGACARLVPRGPGPSPRSDEFLSLIRAIRGESIPIAELGDWRKSIGSAASVTMSASPGGCGGGLRIIAAAALVLRPSALLHDIPVVVLEVSGRRGARARHPSRTLHAPISVRWHRRPATKALATEVSHSPDASPILSAEPSHVANTFRFFKAPGFG